MLADLSCAPSGRRSRLLVKNTEAVNKNQSPYYVLHGNLCLEQRALKPPDVNSDNFDLAF